MYKYGRVGSQNSIQPLQLTGSERGEDSETKTAFPASKFFCSRWSRLHCCVLPLFSSLLSTLLTADQVSIATAMHRHPSLCFG